MPKSDRTAELRLIVRTLVLIKKWLQMEPEDLKQSLRNEDKHLRGKIHTFDRSAEDLEFIWHGTAGIIADEDKADAREREKQAKANRHWEEWKKKNPAT